jgi:hypothetical protein
MARDFRFVTVGSKPTVMPGEMMFSGDYGIGEVFHVCRVDADYAWLQQRVESDHLFKAGGSTQIKAFQDAIAQCVSYRNDYIIVHDGPYAIDNMIDLSALCSVHLIGANGLRSRVGSPGGAFIVQSGAYPTVKLGSWCEIAGLQLWNASGQNTVYANVMQGMNIHHNFIRMIGLAGVTSGINLAGGYGSNYNRVEFNKLIHYAGAAARAAIEVGLGTGQDVCDNEIIVYGSAVYDYGIISMSPGGQVNDNKVSDCGGDGTITCGVYTRTTKGSVVIGNRLQLPTTTGVDGGTANRTYVDNRDAQAGGAVVVET